MTFHDSPKQISGREELEEGIGVFFPSRVLWEPSSAEFILEPKAWEPPLQSIQTSLSRHGGRERGRVDGVREQGLEVNKRYTAPRII